MEQDWALNSVSPTPPRAVGCLFGPNTPSTIAGAARNASPVQRSPLSPGRFPVLSPQPRALPPAAPPGPPLPLTAWTSPGETSSELAPCLRAANSGESSSFSPQNLFPAAAVAAGREAAAAVPSPPIT